MGWDTRGSCPLCVAVSREGSGSPCAAPELHPRLLAGMEPSAQSSCGDSGNALGMARVECLTFLTCSSLTSFEN